MESCGDCCGDLDETAVRRQSKVLKTVLWINAVMFLVEAAAGLYFGSNALLADSLDMLGDTLAYGFTLYATTRSARVKAWASLFKGFLMAFFGFGVIAHVVGTAVFPQVPQASGMALTGLLALATNSVCLYLLWSHRGDDLNMRSVWLCSRNDVIANSGVLVAALGVAYFQAPWPDLAMGAVIAGVVLASAGGVLRDSWAALNDNVLSSKSVNAVASSSKTVEKIAGITAGLSLLCAVHCLMLPLLVVVAPLIGVGFLVEESFEAALIASILILAGGTLFIGFRQHRRLEPAALLAAGIAGIIVSHFLTPPRFEPWIMGAAGLCLAAAQLLNRSHCRACAHCDADAQGQACESAH
jgi:cation diffusion facilitator family transporter